MGDAVAQAAWYGNYDITDERGGCWRVGPLTLWIQRKPQECRIAFERREDPNASGASVSVPSDLAPSPQAEVRRFGVASPGMQVRLAPRLADRSVVAKPETPFYLPGHVELILYVSTPIWVAVQVGTPLTTLLEIPTYRPSDTWFGPSTREGELCYATRTSTRLLLKDVPFRANRAVTPVVIRNRSEETILLERLNLPIPYLSLYKDQQGHFWTDTVNIEKEKAGVLASVRLEKTPPAAAVGASQIAAPRNSYDKSFLTKAFTALLG